MVSKPLKQEENSEELSPLLGTVSKTAGGYGLLAPHKINTNKIPSSLVKYGGILFQGFAVALVLSVGILLNTSRPAVNAGRSSVRSHRCSAAGRSPCVARPGTVHVGDPSRINFASRIDNNLVLHDDFSSLQSLGGDLWRPDVTLGDGNGGFAYYTADETNIALEDSELRIRPGLFASLGRIQTGVPNVTQDARDVMVGNCDPFPECSTFSIPPEACTVSDFSGCQRIGTPLVALNPATSGRVSTRGTFDFTYGRLEARIRLPRGDWLWPALWLMPSDDFYGAWPDSGEIDLVEARGNDPGFQVGGRDGGRDVFVSSLHYAGNCWWHTQKVVRASEVLRCCDDNEAEEGCDFSDAFFTMGLYWSDVRMYSYIRGSDSGSEEFIIWDVNASSGFGPDDAPLGCRLLPLPHQRDQHEQTLMEGDGPYKTASKNSNAPFDRPFHIILNVAVGGEQNGCPDPDWWGENAIWCTNRDVERPEIAASTIFWKSRESWIPTWTSAKVKRKEAFAIDWVNIWQ